MEENAEMQKLKEEEVQLKRIEIELRQKEIDFQRQQYEQLQKEKGFSSRIFSPVGIAVIVGLLGLLGTAASGLITVYVENKKHQADIYLENQKHQAELFLKMSEVQDEKQRAKNLLFFAKGGFLTLSPDYEKYLRQLAGLGENDPVPPPSSAPEAIRKLLPSGTVDGLSLSKFSKKVDLSDLKQQGTQFVYIRVSQGINRKDEAAEQHINAASAAGLKIGLYHFFVPQDDPDQQADNFLSELKRRRWDLPPMIDCEEFPSGEIPSDYADRLYKFAYKIQQETRTKLLIYTNTPFAKQHLDKRFSVFPVAIQRFSLEKKPELPDWWKDFLFWHYKIEESGFEVLDKIVYNGNNESFNHLSEQLKVASNTSP